MYPIFDKSRIMKIASLLPLCGLVAFPHSQPYLLSMSKATMPTPGTTVALFHQPSGSSPLCEVCFPKRLVHKVYPKSVSSFFRS